jgi:hypothetical protein
MSHRSEVDVVRFASPSLMVAGARVGPFAFESWFVSGGTSALPRGNSRQQNQTRVRNRWWTYGCEREHQRIPEGLGVTERESGEQRRVRHRECASCSSGICASRPGRSIRSPELRRPFGPRAERGAK